MGFRGWQAEALDFFEGLEADNSKTYWTEHKNVYDEQVLAPMTALLEALEPEFGGGKVFRPYRDVRFSADKSPYKTNIAATVESGGYIQLSASGLGVGNGMYMMDSERLARYRAAVASDSSGAELEKVIEAIERQRIEVTGHDILKTAPRGYAKDHPRLDLLRYKGLIAWQEWPAAAWLGTAAAKDRVVKFLRNTRPLHDWLTEHTKP